MKRTASTRYLGKIRWVPRPTNSGSLMGKRKHRTDKISEIITHDKRFFTENHNQSTLYGLTTNTGTGDVLTTLSATEPNTTLSRPLRPWVPMITRSIPCDSI